MNCPKCGEQTHIGSDHCIICGADLRPSYEELESRLAAAQSELETCRNWRAFDPDTAPAETTREVIDQMLKAMGAYQAELGFFRSIDWMKLGWFLERDIGYDGHGWERMFHALKAGDEASVIRYLQERFNREVHPMKLLQWEEENPHKTMLDFVTAYFRLKKMHEDAEAEKYKRLYEEALEREKELIDILSQKEEMEGIDCGITDNCPE